IFDGFVFLAGASLLVVLEIGLTAHGQIAEAIEIGLQPGNFIFGFRFFGWRSNRRLVGNRSCRSSPPLLGLAQLGAFVLFLFGHGNFLHVFRIAITVMSSFCGCAPTKFRRSSINRLTTAAAPVVALARTDSIRRSSPNSFPSGSIASVTS